MCRILLHVNFDATFDISIPTNPVNKTFEILLYMTSEITI